MKFSIYLNRRVFVMGTFMSRNVRKRTFWHVRPTKTQISLRIRAVWLESSLSAWRNIVSLAIRNAPVKILIRLCECAGWSDSPLGAHVRGFVFWRCDTFSLNIKLAAPCENRSLGICGQQRPRSACASIQSDQGLPCPLTEPLDNIECMYGEERSGCYYAHAQDELNLRIFEVTFSART